MANREPGAGQAETEPKPVAVVAAGGWRPAVMREHPGSADPVGTAVDLAFCQTTWTALPRYDCGRLLV